MTDRLLVQAFQEQCSSSCYSLLISPLLLYRLHVTLTILHQKLQFYPPTAKFLTSTYLYPLLHFQTLQLDFYPVRPLKLSDISLA